MWASWSTSRRRIGQPKLRASCLPPTLGRCCRCNLRNWSRGGRKLSFGIEKLAFGASCFNATEQLQKEQKETAARSELRTIAFSHRSTGSKCLVLEYLLQINFTNFPRRAI